MSGHGAPEARPVQGAGGLRVAIVAAQWHDTVMSGLLDGARRACADSKPAETIEVRVPGTFELVVAAARLVQAGYDVVVTLGVVIRGETPHFDYVCQGVTTGLSVLAQRTGVPIGFGVLTCNTEAEALDRAGLPGSKEDKGYEAAVAALQSAVTLNTIGSAVAASADKVSAAGEQQ